MGALGLFNLDGVSCGEKAAAPTARIARMKEASKGKDTTIGHWEIAGILSKKPLPTYPEGFPKDVLDAFSRATGRGVLCNKPYSGTEVIQAYGDEHMRTGDLIVYTSADSVFQIAAHEDVVPVETLYDYCRKAREILQGEHGVGRVIARPFTGTSGNYTRTPRRHDFSLLPPSVTMLDQLKDAGRLLFPSVRSRISLRGRALRRRFIRRETRKESHRRFPIWRKISRGSALSTWWTTTCFTGTATMWTGMPGPSPILTGSCRRFWTGSGRRTF